MTFVVFFSFRVAQCECDVGWRGQHCSEDVDGCILNDCTSGNICVDVVPVVEQTQGTSYTCEPVAECETGYERGTVFLPRYSPNIAHFTKLCSLIQTETEIVLTSTSVQRHRANTPAPTQTVRSSALATLVSNSTMTPSTAMTSTNVRLVRRHANKFARTLRGHSSAVTTMTDTSWRFASCFRSKLSTITMYTTYNMDLVLERRNLYLHWCLHPTM